MKFDVSINGKKFRNIEIQEDVLSLKIENSIQKNNSETLKQQMEKLKSHCKLRGTHSASFDRQLRVCIEDEMIMIRKLRKSKAIIEKLVEGIRLMSDSRIELTDVDSFGEEAESFLSEE